jgi:hypothetical protein
LQRRFLIGKVSVGNISSLRRNSFVSYVI